MGDTAVHRLICIDALGRAFSIRFVNPRRVDHMILKQPYVIGASAFLLLTVPCEAGPCSKDIVARANGH